VQQENGKQATGARKQRSIRHACHEADERLQQHEHILGLVYEIRKVHDAENERTDGNAEQHVAATALEGNVEQKKAAEALLKEGPPQETVSRGTRKELDK
jgi:hypothetical protein